MNSKLEAKLMELKRLRDKGMLTEEEYSTNKQLVIMTELHKPEIPNLDSSAYVHPSPEQAQPSCGRPEFSAPTGAVPHQPVAGNPSLWWVSNHPLLRWKRAKMALGLLLTLALAAFYCGGMVYSNASLLETLADAGFANAQAEVQLFSSAELPFCGFGSRNLNHAYAYHWSAGATDGVACCYLFQGCQIEVREAQ